MKGHPEINPNRTKLNDITVSIHAQQYTLQISEETKNKLSQKPVEEILKTLEERINLE